MLALARALHVLGVVIWIGGVAMVTMIILPALGSDELKGARGPMFRALEHRFARFARWMVILVGLTGIYMAQEMHLWSWFASARFWWMHAMVIVWTIFALVLFVLEPRGIFKRLHAASGADSDGIFRRIQRMHIVLLTLALVTILGAVAGSHGWMP